ncbi:hypothetical protein JHN63_51510 [Streptomyces sp. MBT65]|uniref:hypothetical protein n=1 Tax=Streptomyces sp. MBT65 TaxID=1488395 RepID=UPI00190CFA7D|nr:hypothetical protein [Streptomyces sp. MBT65]MBK3582025.1 hypothetical protein [Streptomyces sp. MBT65]
MAVVAVSWTNSSSRQPAGDGAVSQVDAASAEMRAIAYSGRAGMLLGEVILSETTLEVELSIAPRT